MRKSPKHFFITTLDRSESINSSLPSQPHSTPGSNLTLHDEIKVDDHTTTPGENSREPSSKSAADQVMLGGMRVVAGSASSSHCIRCGRKANEMVCGANGQTFPTLCHAVHCGGLSLNDITYGDCRNKVSNEKVP